MPHSASGTVLLVNIVGKSDQNRVRGARLGGTSHRVLTRGTVTLHLVKLCVGVENVASLAEWQAYRTAQRAAAGEGADLYHRTRQMPRRADELLDGGSLYWVIKGVIQVRQRVLGLKEVRCDDGIRRCDIILGPELVLTRPMPRRAFQGWRYLAADDAPKDLTGAAIEANELPEKMRAELIELGLF
jgi:hypothetical protein